MIEHSVTLPEGNLKRVHVDQGRIRANHKDGTNLPPVTVQAQGGPYKGHHVQIHGESAVIYREESPLSCGARLWIETRARVSIVVEEPITLAELATLASVGLAS